MGKNEVIQDRIKRIKDLNYSYEQQPKQIIYECNICGSDKWIELSHLDRYGFPVKACGCISCGMIFLNPLMTEDGYRFFYQSIYRKLVSAFHGRLIDAISIQNEQYEYAVELADFLADNLGKRVGSTVLDVGGSTGVVSLHLKNIFNMDPLVLDPSPDEIKQAQKLGLATHISLLEDFSPQNKSFELIILCQTIDHLLDIKGSLAKIRTLMSDQSLFFVDIVDFRAAYLRNWSIEAAVKIDHPYYFTQESIQSVLKRVGFEVIRTRYAKDKLHIGYLCRKKESESNYLPESAELDLLWREIRFVQNTERIVS